MGFVRANGGVIHYRDEGPRDGPAIVLVNALGSDLRIWDEAGAHLIRDFRVIRYDKRGHGLSEAGPDRYDMADYAGDLAGLLDALGVARTTLVGLSIGGLVAQQLYRDRRTLFEAPRPTPTPPRRSATTRAGTRENRGDRGRWGRGGRGRRARALVHRRLPRPAARTN